MWTSSNFQTYKKQYDFTSSERCKPCYTVLKIDDTDFINMIEGLEGEIHDGQIFQTILCSVCGTYRCEPGNWVALRQASRFVFFIPAFDEMQGGQNLREYDSPYWLKQKGSFWLTMDDFQEFKKLVPELVKQKSINRISKSELLSLYKTEIPHKLFGSFPDFEPLKQELILAVSELDNSEFFEIIELKLKELEMSSDFELIPLKHNDTLISAFLDDSSTTEWKALCKAGGDYDLVLGGIFRIKSNECSGTGG